MPKPNTVADRKSETASAQKPVQTETVPVETTTNVVETKPAETVIDTVPAVAETVTETAPAPAETVATEPAAAETPAETVPAPAETPAPENAGFIPGMLDTLAASKSRSSGGSKIRPNVGYTLVAAGVAKLANTNVPEQEQVILKILNRALTPAKPVISEPELNKLVLAAYHSGALKTKQDAWHIFRYYRTDLVKRGALKQVDIAI